MILSALARQPARLLLLCALLCLPALSQAQTDRDAMQYEFTYSLLEFDGDIDDVLAALEGQVMAAMQLSGARPYAIWTPLQLPQDAPFAGLAANQVGYMLAWPRATEELLPSLDLVLRSVSGVAEVTTRVFTPVYLGANLEVAVGGGFYVHRDEHYGLDNVDQAVALSREAWVTWEPAWGTHVVGLFREKPDVDGVARLTRIAWYADYDAWQATRDFQQDPESARRFSQRRQLLIEGSGVATATDRLVPD